MRYKHFAKYSLVAANISLLNVFCVGVHDAVVLLGSLFLLLAICFWLVQGRFRVGYYYALALLGLAIPQWYLLPIVHSLISVGVAAVAITLQTIEFLIKDKPLIDLDCPKH